MRSATSPTERDASVSYSAVTGNGTDANRGPAGERCADLASGAPKLVNSTCGTSTDNPVNSGGGNHWNVCTFD